MDVTDPEKLVRGMYGENPDRPEVIGGNDIGPGSIPLDLQEIVQQPRSVDPVKEEIPHIHTDLTVNAEKVAEENPQSRFRILDVPIKKPGVCALCGDSGGDGRQFVDFGKSVEWYGVVYFCTVCVSEAASLLGLGSVQISEEFASELNRKLGNAHSENFELKEQLNAARILLRTCVCSDVDSSVSVDEVPEADIIESESPSDDDKSNDSDEPNPDESDPIEGSDDVSAAPVDDEPKPVRKRRGTNSSTG